MTLEWSPVGMDKWQAHGRQDRYQISFTGTRQHGPWRLAVYYDPADKLLCTEFNCLPDRDTAERIANEREAGTPGLEPGTDALTGRCSAN